MNKGDRVKVLKDMGRDWFIVLGREDAKGYMHGTWLDFGNSKMHADPRSAFHRFQEDLQRLLVPGQLTEFPVIKDYIDSCTDNACQQYKEAEGSLGICLHDLEVLLGGSGNYCHTWLKESRNVWHPDRFARYCHPDHVEHLKPMAEQMFVYYGILMAMA